MVEVVVAEVAVVLVVEVVSVLLFAELFFKNLALNLYERHFFYYNLNDHRKRQRV